MVIQPKVRGFICINAHPVGCAKNVEQQIEYIKRSSFQQPGARNVLVIGSSTGYGLSSRITAAYGYDANTIGVFFEKPPTERKTASAGFYNAAAFDKYAKEDGKYAKSVNVDAFTNEAKQKLVDLIQADMNAGLIGKIDLVVYSLAAPRRTDPNTGQTYVSVLKPISNAYTAKNLNTDTQIIDEITVEPANQDEIDNTIKVMGGEDWQLWMQALQSANVLSDDCKTVAYTYIGDKLTKPIYGHATIGKAKEHLDEIAQIMRTQMNLDARVSVLKAVVTQASSAIPVMPLYLSILFKYMQQEGTHEGCIEQLQRLFTECIYSSEPRLDSEQRYRVDEKELKPELQAKIEEVWQKIETENLHDLSDFSAYKNEFLRLFGFALEGVDYQQDVDTMVESEFI